LPEKEGFQKAVIEEQRELVTKEIEQLSLKNQTDEDVPSKMEVDKTAVDNDTIQTDLNGYGEQVVIAHADSTSCDDLIVDIESDGECEIAISNINEDKTINASTEQFLPVREAPEETIKTNNDQKNRYLLDFPKHDWLVEQLKQENKLKTGEIEQIERAVHKQQHEQQQEQKRNENTDFLKKFLVEKRTKRSPKIDSNNNENALNVHSTTEVEYNNKRLEVISESTKREDNSHRRSYIYAPSTPVIENESFQLSSPPRRIQSPPKHLQQNPSSPMTKTHFHYPVTSKTLSNEVFRESTCNKHLKIKRQISDISDMRPAAWVFSPSVSPPMERSIFMATKSPTDHCKTRIYKPDDIERCFRNVSPVEHSKFIYHPYQRMSPSRDQPKTFIHRHGFTEEQKVSPITYRKTIRSYDNNDNEMTRMSFPQSKGEYNAPRSRIQSDSTAYYLGSNEHYHHQLRAVKRPSSEPNNHIRDKRSPVMETIPSPGFDSHHFHSSPNNNKVIYKVEKDFKTHSTTPVKKYSCMNCGKRTQMLCSGCHGVGYCSRQCQVRIIYKTN